MPTPRGCKYRSPMWQRVVLLFPSTLLAIAAGEVEGSPFHHKSRWNLPDPELRFVRRAGIEWQGRATADPDSHFVHYRTDENGFRNPPGLRAARIAFVGDSFTEAGSVPVDERERGEIEDSPSTRSGFGTWLKSRRLSQLWRVARRSARGVS